MTSGIFWLNSHISGYLWFQSLMELYTGHFVMTELSTALKQLFGVWGPSSLIKNEHWKDQI